MKTVNAARGPGTRHYYYDAVRKSFTVLQPGVANRDNNPFCQPTHHIIVDDSYTAAELDDLFDAILPPEESSQ